MTQRTYLTLFSVGTLASWFGWGQAIRLQTPTSATVIDFFLFYVLLFFAVLGTMTILGTLVRLRMSDRLRNCETTVRQALFYALFVVGLLLLQSFRLLRWWNFFLLLFLLTLVEFFFLVAKTKNSPTAE